MLILYWHCFVYSLQLSTACNEDINQDAICLSRAAEIVRREIFGDRPKWSFNGSFQFPANCNDNSVPNTLLALVSMILEGPSIDVQSLQQNVHAAASIAQLIVFNSVCSQTYQSQPSCGSAQQEAGNTVTSVYRS